MNNHYNPSNDAAQYAAGECALIDLKKTNPAEYAHIAAMGDESFNLAVLALGSPIGTCLPLSHAPEKSNADVMATAHAFVKTERLAKYARWAAEEVGKIIAEDDNAPEDIRECAVSFLADRLAISDGLTLMQVGQSHYALASGLVAAVPLYIAGWTGSDAMYFTDVAQAREYVAAQLQEEEENLMQDERDSATGGHMAQTFRVHASALRAMDHAMSNHIALFDVAYYVRAV
jgi:hypothetical protein